MVLYTCELCGEIYEDYKKAFKCEGKGLIGPDIKEGLVVGTSSHFSHFSIFLKEGKSYGHEKRYEIFTPGEYPVPCASFSSSYLEEELKNKVHKLLNEKEFDSVRKEIKKSKNIKEVLKEKGIEIGQLYRYHPYFDKKINSS